MIKKVLMASCLLLMSIASHASLISHLGYERAAGSNYVTGGGLEWLMWDVTKGMSINAARDKYALEGWTLASNRQMADLFNAFQFGKTDWVAGESELQSETIPWDVEENSRHNMFIDLFGYTAFDGGPNYRPVDPLIFSMAFFGSDSNKNGRFQYASLYDDSIDISFDVIIDHHARISDEYGTESWSLPYAGVALVRVVKNDVTLPGSISLLALGFIALGFRRRQFLRR